MKSLNSIRHEVLRTPGVTIAVSRFVLMLGAIFATQSWLHAQVHSVDYTVRHYAGRVCCRRLWGGIVTDSDSNPTFPVEFGPAGFASPPTVDPGSATNWSYALAYYGFLRAHSYAGASAGFLGLSDVTASWTDSVTVHSPGVSDGTDGTWTPDEISISGTGLAAEPAHWGINGKATSTYQLSMLLERAGHDPQLQAVSGSWTSTDGDGLFNFLGDSVGTLFPAPFAITWGEEMTFTVALQTSSSITTFLNPAPPPLDQYGVADGDFEHTVSWLGMGELRDGNGDLIQNFTVASESGNDWTQPVPEPGVMALAGLGLVAWIAGRRFRR